LKYQDLMVRKKRLELLRLAALEP